jgi:uncharacterized membrane protein
MFILQKKPDMEQELSSADERIMRIREKASRVAFFVTLGVLTALALALAAMDMFALCLVVVGIMAVHAAGYFISVAVLKKKM